MYNHGVSHHHLDGGAHHINNGKPPMAMAWRPQNCSLSNLRFNYAFANFIVHDRRVFRTDRYKERFWRIRQLAVQRIECVTNPVRVKVSGGEATPEGCLDAP